MFILFKLFNLAKQNRHIMKTTKTTPRTKRRAEALSMHLFGEITSPCQHHINNGEEAAAGWITRICKKYNVTV